MGEKKRLKLILLSLFIPVVVANATPVAAWFSWLSSFNHNYANFDMMKEIFVNSAEQRMCPDVPSLKDEATTCNDNDPKSHPHKIVSCQELRLGEGTKNLTFSCKCKYLESGNRLCDTNRKVEYQPIHNECLFVYVGMAVIFGYAEAFLSFI